MRYLVLLVLVVAILACAQPSNEPPPEVKLTWDPVPDEEVTGYNVYRSEESGGGYARVNPSRLVEPEYTDTTVKRGRTYFYRVTAVSRTGVESGFSVERSKAVD